MTLAVVVVPPPSATAWRCRSPNDARNMEHPVAAPAPHKRKKSKITYLQMRSGKKIRQLIQSVQTKIKTVCSHLVRSLRGIAIERADVRILQDFNLLPKHRRQVTDGAETPEMLGLLALITKVL